VKTIYISGPITGIPRGNREAFADAAQRLKAAGYHPINPHDIGGIVELNMQPADPAWSDYMRPCIAAVMGCDGIALLPDWHKSRGAQKEIMAASWVYIPSKPLAEWLSDGGES
jgi:Domain of unknown function (DUF4406)